MLNKITNILICGVGGQGILLASEILSEAALRSGYDVKKSEVHGMAQRGGSVVSNIRYGNKIYSPLIKEREADFIFSFELMETLRYLHMLKNDGLILVNNQKISPTNINIKSSFYPQNVEELCRKHYNNFLLINALEIAKEIKNIKTINVIMLGALSAFLKIEEQIWYEAIKSKVKEKFIDINLKAFELGRKVAIKN